VTRLARLAVALTLVAVIVACGNKTPQSPSRPKSSATITIVEPTAGQTVSGKTFKDEMRLDGGRIVKQVSQALTPDEGHVHLSIDGKIQSMTFGLKQKLKMPSPGSHLLQAEFVAKDHGPFLPRVLSTVTFTVKK
jgi:hypothetical protein